MKDLHVKDEHRTNELSIRPGGSTVKVCYEDGRSLVYDKVKKPHKYINSISKLGVREILIDGKRAWPDGKSC
jgi:hypothetical protein